MSSRGEIRFRARLLWLGYELIDDGAGNTVVRGELPAPAPPDVPDGRDVSEILATVREELAETAMTPQNYVIPRSEGASR